MQSHTLLMRQLIYIPSLSVVFPVRMEGRWRVAAGAMLLVVVGLLGLLKETRAQEPTSGSFFGPPKDIQGSLKDMLKNPAIKASRNLHRLLVGEKNTRASLESGLSMYLPSMDPDVTGNDKCRSDVFAIYQAIFTPELSTGLTVQGKFWHFKIPDSWGKTPDGILYGNIMPWGMKEECTLLNVKETFPTLEPPMDINFQGRYCLVSIGQMKLNGTDDEDDEFETPEMRVGEEMAYPEVPPIFRYGTCMPNTCTPDDLRTSIDNELNPVNREAVHIDCYVEDYSEPYNSGDIAFIVIMSILFTVVFVAAVIDLFIDHLDLQELRKGPLRFVLVFSAYSNMKSTFAIKLKEHPDVISCLHGLRVFTMVWVVWGHGYMLQASVTNNLVHYKEMSDGVLNQIVFNSTYSVDTFLFMSGLLVTYCVLLEREKVGRVNWIMYYIHRFFRLSPPIMFTAAACATVFRFAMVGPYAQEMERQFVDSCRNTWWEDTLFVGNLVNGLSCLPQCWYTAVDFQLYIVAPLVILPLFIKPTIIGLVWLGVVTLASVAVPMITTAVYDLTPAGLFFLVGEVPPKGMPDLYTKPWARASSYLVGIWTGWLLMQVRGRKLKIHPAAVVAGWLVSAGIALAVLFGLAEYNVMTLDDPKFGLHGILHSGNFDISGFIEEPKYISQAASILYGGLSRLAWGVALMWVVFACHTGYGGIMNSILSHPSLQPLSRLTYALFLVTIPVQLFYMGATYIPLYVNHLNKIIETLGYLFFGGLLAVPLTLTVERPILGFERLLYPRKGRGLIEQKVEDKKKD